MEEKTVEAMLNLTPMPRERRPFAPGDVVDLGSGITWRLSASLARSLNRQRRRALKATAP